MCYTISYEEVKVCERCKIEEPVEVLDTFQACRITPSRTKWTRNFDHNCEKGFHEILPDRHRFLSYRCRDCVKYVARAGRYDYGPPIDPTARLKSEGRYDLYERADYEDSGDETERPHSPRDSRIRTKRRHTRPQQTVPGDESEMSGSEARGGHSLRRRSSHRSRDLRQDFSDGEGSFTDSVPVRSVPMRRDRPSVSRSAVSTALTEESDLTSIHTRTEPSAAASGTSRHHDSGRHERRASEQTERVNRLEKQLSQRYWVPPVGGFRPRERFPGDSQGRYSQSGSVESSRRRERPRIVQSPSESNVSTQMGSLSTEEVEDEQSWDTETELSERVRSKRPMQ